MDLKEKFNDVKVAIINFFKAVWDKVKQIFVKVLNFFKNIVDFFRKRETLNELKEDKNKIAVSIKDNLDNGNYNVINCLYDTKNEEIVDYKNKSEIIHAEDMDSETKTKFADKDMIIIK